MGARGAIRAVGRAIGEQLGVSPKMSDNLARMVPLEPNITLKIAMDKNPDLMMRYEDKKFTAFLDICFAVEGLSLYTSKHAGGVLITDARGVTEHVPVWDQDGSIVSQYDMTVLDELGLLKMDILGLKTLGIVGEALKLIYHNHGKKLRLQDLYKPMDMAPLGLLRQGLTQGIFQVEGDAMTNFIVQLQPENIEEWIAAISLYRPGPMEFIPTYLRNRKDPSLIQYPFKELQEILDPTFGVLCYQEQCMETVVKVAHYDRSDSDSFRKVVAKKKQDLIPLHRKWFTEGRKAVDLDEYGNEKDYGHPIPGGIERGYDREALESFFGLMEDFGKYALIY